ncbi:MAG: DUF488 domain-containing protein [Sedimentisphaerales bacterium]|nr:DUF488 domain-containing protein [Sedimentisphaerales bacterium]
MKTARLYTIGHSNLSFETFVSLLKEFEIDLVADIRRYPSSRKFPHFNRPILCDGLAAEGIDYQWIEALGGRRHGEKNEQSPNIGLTSPGFRNYADYMATEKFRSAVRELLSAAEMFRTTVMCAEKLYWKCHRRILSDYLISQGVEVIHILGPGESSIHKLSSIAVATKTGVTYPASESTDGQMSLFDLNAQTDSGNV